MADSIVRLQLDSQGYDANIRRATDSLMKYEEECRKVGGTLEVVEKETLDYVKALGDMQTKSKSTKGQIGELTKGYTELAMQYKRLTDEEKKSPYGQALAGSLDKLKGRIKETRKELKEVEEGLKDTEKAAGKEGLVGKLDELAGKFGLNIQQLTAWGAAFGIATGAFKVFKAAFMQNEQNLDEWARLTDSAKSSYTGFLNALSTGDLSGYFRNINDIIGAARAAYDALDALGTFNAFNQVNLEGAKTDFTQAIADYRSGELSKDDAKLKGEAYKAELETRKKFEQKAYEDAIKKIAEERTLSPDDLLKIFSGSYGKFEELTKLGLTGTETVNFGGMSGFYSYSKEVAAPANERERLGQVLRQLTDTEIDAVQKLGAAAQKTGYEIASVDRQMARLLREEKPIVPTPTPKALPGLTPLGGALGMEYAGAGIQEFGLQMGAQGQALLQRNMAGALSGVQGWKEEKVPVDPEKQLEAFEGMIGGLNQVSGGLEAMGIELPEGVSKLLNGIGGLITVIQGISAVIVATQAIIEMNTATQFLPFAHGGVVRAANGFVGGTSWSGDRVPALLNSGELVLNRAQQGNLASQLSGAGWQNMRLETEISGTNLRIILNNEGRSRGKGKLVYGS